MIKDLLIIAVSAALLNNVVLSQFLGLCSFIGVSTNTKTAAGMGGARFRISICCADDDKDRSIIGSAVA